MFPMNKPRGLMGSSLSRSAPVPTFAPANSDVSMGSNRRDRTQEQYQPNEGYRPPAIAPTNAMTPSGSIPGAPNPMGYGTPGMMSAVMPMGNRVNDPAFDNRPNPMLQGVPGLGPSFMDYKKHMESNLPMQRNNIQTNTNRISQGLTGIRNNTNNNLSFMGQPVNFGDDQRIQMDRKARY